MTNTDFTFPLALCKAQYGIWLHALSMFETIGSRTLQDCIALTRAEMDAVMRAGDWHALAMAPMQALRQQEQDGPAPGPAAMPQAAAQVQPSRKAVVNEALRTLHGALASAPSGGRTHAGRKVVTARQRA
ncbi:MULTISPECIES: hypothetical protein [Variovorax]|jgi:hypothetical protein|uniref:hypothetical protein n=1 Tax=Variovorax TaxID=34072 RepID=UPI00086DBE7F|nr:MULTISPECIES: hypothetical protein [Variovorax]MBN8758187.1 hypothetical protein [Variovorax sp.]ODU12824.1 MAG: hypothetical protein ABS94_29070 [Variovorax sp. SCN 67-85]ODV19609.1 MAG: hypothetical protein ABT25_26145 [Variovorax sp. SCN 67-20]OJZ06844.1 MAG: hypothetical protein BGP22_20265 [Variovorax sp. 67-131]UKI07742.1 hypothetical protein L3V85_33960 [Variovorax paradoxus]